jgi:hypothetical protein
VCFLWLWGQRIKTKQLLVVLVSAFVGNFSSFSWQQWREQIPIPELKHVSLVTCKVDIYRLYALVCVHICLYFYTRIYAFMYRNTYISCMRLYITHRRLYLVQARSSRTGGHPRGIFCGAQVVCMRDRLNEIWAQDKIRYIILYIW